MDNPKELKETFLQIVDNQIEQNDPPETAQTLKRLMKEGWSKMDAKNLIAQCVVVEIWNINKHMEPFNMERFKNNLSKLPEEPFD